MRYELLKTLILGSCAASVSACSALDYQTPEQATPDRFVTTPDVALENLAGELIYDGSEPLPEGEKGIVVRVKKLSLLNNARFFSNGKSVSIEVDELISESATITTFEAAAPQGHPGKHGGFISIKAKKLVGRLNVITHGQKGGLGSKGIKGSQGPQGLKGDSIHRGFLVPQGMCRGEDRSHWINTKGIDPFAHHLAKGKRGEIGAVGGQGTSGFPGGNSGTAIIEIPNLNPLQLHVEILPGQGGDGGEGGDGGDPGPGGPPGDILSNSPSCNADAGNCCQPPPPGDPGESQGPKGPIGPVGQPGLRERVSINGIDF